MAQHAKPEHPSAPIIAQLRAVDDMIHLCERQIAVQGRKGMPNLGSYWRDELAVWRSVRGTVASFAVLAEVADAPRDTVAAIRSAASPPAAARGGEA